MIFDDYINLELPGTIDRLLADYDKIAQSHEADLLNSLAIGSYTPPSLEEITSVVNDSFALRVYQKEGVDRNCGILSRVLAIELMNASYAAALARSGNRTVNTEKNIHTIVYTKTQEGGVGIDLTIEQFLRDNRGIFIGNQQELLERVRESAFFRSWCENSLPEHQLPWFDHLKGTAKTIEQDPVEFWQEQIWGKKIGIMNPFSDEGIPYQLIRCFSNQSR